MRGRRTNRMNGFVDFPVSSKDWKNSKEGGMFVQLWIPAKKRWGVCLGVETIHAKLNECLMGTDTRQNKDNMKEMLESMKKSKGKRIIEQVYKLERELFPHHPAKDEWEKKHEFDSIGLLACVTLGSTGWSGYHNRKGYWRCRYTDLSLTGKEIYRTLWNLYGIKPMLVTWLDT